MGEQQRFEPSMNPAERDDTGHKAEKTEGGFVVLQKFTTDFNFTYKSVRKGSQFNSRKTDHIDAY